MEENAAEKTKYMEHVVCPGCGQQLELELQMSLIDECLYVWFEGICVDCQHKLVDPMPIVRADLNEAARKIIAN